MSELVIGGRIKTIQTTVLLKSARILRRVLVARGNMLSVRLLRKLSLRAGVKNPKVK